MEAFITLIEHTYANDPSTRCILVAPDRPRQAWCQRLITNPLFQLLEVYPAEATIFSAHNAHNPLVRRTFTSNNERILIFEVNQHPMHQRRVTWDQLPHPQAPVVREMPRLGYLDE